MPRPLIIKVDSHKLQPNKKATGSISVQLLRGVTKGSYYESRHIELDSTPSDADDYRVNPPEERGSRSIVRSLISRYETSPDNANLIKYKSKSMGDLQKPQISTVAKKTQDDFLYTRGRYSNDEPDNPKFDFKKVFSKFETSKHAEPKTPRAVTANQSMTEVKQHKPTNFNQDALDLNNIIFKATALLELHYRGHEYSSWQDQVLEFLQQIEKLGNSNSSKTNLHVRSSYVSKPDEKASCATDKQEHTLQRAKSLDHGELSKNLKVRDIKNIFEAKPDNTKPISRSVSSYATYFGLKSTDEEETNFNSLTYPTMHQQISTATPFNEDVYNNQVESEDSDSLEDSYDVEFANEEITSDLTEANRISTQPVMASSMKIQELKNLFESEVPDKYVPYKSYVENDKSEETNSAAKLFSDSEVKEIHKLVGDTNGNASVEGSMQEIEEVTKKIEDFEQQIANISEENKDESSYLSEVLIKMLIKLDGIKTYGDALILTERRKAIQFVQNCISKLREKVKETE